VPATRWPDPFPDQLDDLDHLDPFDHEDPMAFIQTIPEDEADGAVAELYAADRESDGYVGNSTKAYSLRPQALLAWEQLGHTIKSGMDLRRYELATLAAARRLRSSYCSLAHGQVVIGKGLLDADQLQAVVIDHHDAGLDEVDVAVMDLADKVTADATAVTEDDIARLRDLGCTDAEILDVILTAALRCFFSKVLDATGARPDAALRTAPAFTPDLVATLTVGRPIADH
jgi:uncharacterized peroxidase-related enzyme